MKRKKLSLQHLMYDNRIVLVLSLVAAFVIWIVVAMQFSPEDDVVIETVPVKLEVSNNVTSMGLQPFGNTEFYVDVTVRGKRYEVADSVLTKDDITVVARTNYVDAAGSHTLTLEARPNDPNNANYEIISLSSDSISVFFDYYKEGEYTLDPQVIFGGESLVPDGYIADSPLLSANTVMLSGAATEMNKIANVEARVSVDNQLTSTYTTGAEIVPLSDTGSRLQYITVNGGDSDVTMTVPVYKRANMPTTVTFRNVPAAYENSLPSFSCSPANLEFGMDETALAGINRLSVADIDFSMLRPGRNEIIIDLSELNGVKILSDVTQVTVTVTVSSTDSKYLNVSADNISFINVPNGYSAVVTQTRIYDAEVVGPAGDLGEVSAAQLLAQVDLQDVDVSRTNGIAKARAYVQNSQSCWVYGRYDVSYRLEKNS